MKRCSGMTLLELLLATAILAIMAGMGLFGIQTLMRAEQGVQAKEAQWRTHNMTLVQMTQDVQFALSLPVTSQRQAFSGDALGFSLLKHQSHILPDDGQAKLGLAEMQSVQWRMINGQLTRGQSPWLQFREQNRPQPYLPLKQMRCEYLDISSQWQPRWPISGGQSTASLPKQVKCRLTFDDERISDWVLIPWLST